MKISDGLQQRNALPSKNKIPRSQRQPISFMISRKLCDYYSEYGFILSSFIFIVYLKKGKASLER